MKHKFNLKRQSPDERDFQITNLLKEHTAVKIPTKMDLRALCPPVYDQGDLGSCSANAGCAARVMLGKLTVELSRLFQYYNERVIENTISSDAGAQMRDIGKAMLTYGIAEEKLWPYDIAKFAHHPSSAAETNAPTHKIGSYHSVPDLDTMKQIIAINKEPVMFGFSVYESFEGSAEAKTGIIPMPKKSEQLLGGHAVLAVGYDDAKKHVICRNSWGVGWGDKGYFYLPYTYFTKGLAYDFWVLQN